MGNSQKEQHALEQELFYMGILIESNPLFGTLIVMLYVVSKVIRLLLLMQLLLEATHVHILA